MMSKEGMERLMRLLDQAMGEMVNSTASQKAFDLLSKAMTIVERSYYAAELVDDGRQMELDFSEPDYRNLPSGDDDG